MTQTITSATLTTRFGYPIGYLHVVCHLTMAQALDLEDPALFGWGLETVVVMPLGEVRDALYNEAFESIASGAEDMWVDSCDSEIRRAIKRCDTAINF